MWSLFVRKVCKCSQRKLIRQRCSLPTLRPISCRTELGFVQADFCKTRILSSSRRPFLPKHHRRFGVHSWTPRNSYHFSLFLLPIPSPLKTSKVGQDFYSPSLSRMMRGQREESLSLRHQWCSALSSFTFKRLLKINVTRRNFKTNQRENQKE